jgi:Domain of unknown function (DUF1929)
MFFRASREELRLKRCLVCWLAVLLVAASPSTIPVRSAAHDECATPASAYGVRPTTLLEAQGPKEKLGAWYEVPLPPVKDRMQCVHAALLPSGKVLMVSGSSFRLTKKDGKIIEGVDGTNYDAVNNSALFDPTVPLGENGFKRIASPPTPIDGEANDLFCSGHLQTPDGNIVFAGGNRFYYPGMQFTGSRFANIFDWKQERWLEVARLKDGHWYPTLVALANGQIAVFSGLGYELNSGNSSWVEFYDYTQPPQRAWTAIDIRTLPNSPFNTPFTGGGAALDAMDHYPRMFSLADGRLFISGDGSGGGEPRSRNTYFMTINPSNDAQRAPQVSFASGPERTVSRRIYGTALVDPNSLDGDILLMGGMLGTERTSIGPNFPPLNKDAVTANLERFTVPSASNTNGRWEVTPQFLGDRPEDVRIMHVATILPNKQVLIMGGGNYAFHCPIFTSLLCTYDLLAPGKYRVARMNPGTQPRLYHSVSLLLPDGRVFAAGGNAARAARNFVDGSIDLYINRNPTNDTFSPAEEGTYAISAEIYQIEIFYPPYLFAPGPRPEITSFPKEITYGQPARLNVKNMTPTASLVLIKLGSVTHGFDSGQRLIDLTFSQDLDNGTLTFRVPTNRNTSPPAYYMLFYVNNIGKPSIAPILRISDSLTPK